MFFPMIEACGLFATIESRCLIAKMGQRVGLKFLMQQLCDDVTYLLNRETRGQLFPPSLFLRQEPSCYQRERLMMMPAPPRPHLILCQARFALGSPKAFFHSMLRTEHPRELSQRRLERSVRQGVVVLHRLSALPFAEDHQRFFGAVATPSLRPTPVRRGRHKPYRRRLGSCPPCPLVRTTVAPRRPTPCLV